VKLLGIFHTGTSTCKVISLVLQLSVPTAASARITRMSTRGHSGEKLARWPEQVNWWNWSLFYLFWHHFKISHPVKW